MTQQKLAVIGECMIELSQQGREMSRGFGGDTLNTAVYFSPPVARRGPRGDYVTALVTDSVSRGMIAARQAERLHTGGFYDVVAKIPCPYASNRVHV